jgi:hypothetical protein
MKAHVSADNAIERRSETRSQIGRYFDVSFLYGGPNGIYRLKIMNRSSNSLGLAVKNGSDILSSIRVGDTLGILYNPIRISSYCVYMRTVVRHITKKYQGPLYDHSIVGLETLPRQALRS